MKRKLAFILVISMMATVLWACDDKAKKEDAAKEEKQEEQVTDTKPEQQTSSDGNPEYAYTAVEYDSGYEYFNGTIQCVEITDGGHQALADAVNKYFSDSIKNFNKTCEQYVEDSKETNQQLSQDKEDNEGAENEFVYNYTAYYTYDIYCQVTRCDDKMLSIKIDEYSFTGGANGTNNEYGVNFDVQTGEILTNDSFDGFKDNVKEAILKDIDNSTEDAKAYLFDDYKDTIDYHFDGGFATLGVCFNERGMIVIFPETDIAAHAAGNINFNIPYSKLEGFDEKYLPDGNFYTVDIDDEGFADYIDVNDDGEDELVYLELVDEGENGNTYKLHVGDDAVNCSSDEIFQCLPMFIHSSTGNYFAIDTTGYSDWHVTYLYDVAKSYHLIQKINGHITEINDGRCTIEYKVDAFGSWGAKKEYTYDGTGFTTTDTVDNLDNLPSKGDAKGITLLKKLKYIDNNDEEQTLDKGTVIYPTVLDGDKLEFMTEDGSASGYFTFEYTDGVRYVDGVSEYDLFDNMPYAG